MIFYEFYEVLSHVNLVGATLQQNMIVSLAVMQLEEQFRLAWMLADNLVQLLNNQRVEIISGNIDGEPVDGALLDSRQIFDVLHLQVVEIAVAETRHTLGCDIHRRPHDKHAVPFSPVLTEEGKLASAIVILY